MHCLSPEVSIMPLHARFRRRRAAVDFLPKRQFLPDRQVSQLAELPPFSL